MDTNLHQRHKNLLIYKIKKKTITSVRFMQQNFLPIQSKHLRLCNPENKGQYIQFHDSKGQKLNIILKQQNIHKQLFTLLQEQISGYRYRYKTYSDQKQLIQIIKNITVFSNFSTFHGFRRHDWDIHQKLLDQKVYIRLKLTHIEHITFRNLTRLHFSNCHLESVQPLIWLDMNVLRELQISQNDIISLKQFGKISLAQLGSLRMDSNKFNYHQLNYLNRFRIPEVKEIYFQRCQQNQQMICLQDLRCLVKLQIATNKKNWSNSKYNKQKSDVFSSRQQIKLEEVNWKQKVNKHTNLQLNEGQRRNWRRRERQGREGQII